MKKNTVIEMLNSFEDEFDVEKLIERLLFVEKIGKGLNDAQEGKVIDFNDVKKLLFNRGHL